MRPSYRKLVVVVLALTGCGKGNGHASTPRRADAGPSRVDDIPESWTVPSWYVDPANVTGNASDANTCTTAADPCLTYAEIATLWGTYAPRLRQNTTITFLSSQSTDGDPVYLDPSIENGAAVRVEGVLGSAQQVASGTLSLVTGRQRAAGQLLQVELPAGVAPGQLVVNLADQSRAWIYRNAGGDSWYLSQPLAQQSLPLTPGAAPLESNGWSAGQPFVVYQPVAVDVAATAPIAGPGGAGTPLTFHQLRVVSPPARVDAAAPDAGTSARSTLAVASPDVAFVEASIDRFVSFGENSSSNRPDFVNVDFSGGLDAQSIGPEAGMSVMGGQIRTSSWRLWAATLDDDVVIGSTVSMSGGSYGSVFIDTSAALLVQQNDVSFTQAHGAPVLWGPGSVDAIAQGRLEYPPGAGGAQATFQMRGLYVDQSVTSVTQQPLPAPGTACAVDLAGGWLCGIAVTAANLDGPLSGGGFAGTAIDPGGATITDSNPLVAGPDAGAGEAPFQSDMLLWLRADRGITQASDGSVAVWADQTGLGGRDAVPFPGLEGPLYVADAYGSFPAIRGDGTRSLLVNGGHGYSIGQQSSLFMVASSSTAGTAGVTYYDESTQGWQYSIYQDSNGIHWLNASGAALDGGTTGAFPFNGSEDTFLFTSSPSSGLHVFAETQHDQAQAAGYYDGPQVASIMAPVGPSLYVMSLFGGPGNAFNAGDGGSDPQGVTISSGSFDTNGDVEEVIQYGRALSPSEVAQVYAYLRGRWPNRGTPPSADAGTPEAGANCTYQPATAPSGAPVCGDGWRDPATEECDDGLGDAGIRRGCSSTCTVLDELAISQAATDGGLSNTPRSLAAGRHPVAAGVLTLAVTTLEGPSSPPTISLSTFSRKGAATGVVVPISAGSVVADQGDPVVAALPCDQYAVAWNDRNGDGDGLGVALRLFTQTTAPTGVPSFANKTTAFDQYDPDVLWTGSSLVVAWTDTSNATTGPDVRYRTFDATLTPTSGEQTLAATPDVEGDVTLAPFEGSWAAAWRDDANGLETIGVQAGLSRWTVGPAFLPPSVTTKLALVELDASNLLVIYSMGFDPGDSGVASAESTLMAAVLNVSAPGMVTGAAVPVNTAVEGATAAALSHAYADAVRVGTSVYAAWWTDAVTGDPAGEQVWFQPVGWDGSTLSWGGTELSLPRSVVHRTGNQRRLALAASTLEPGGALVSAWDDLGGTFGAGEGNGDVVVELVPVPVLRIGAQ